MRKPKFLIKCQCPKNCEGWILGFSNGKYRKYKQGHCADYTNRRNALICFVHSENYSEHARKAQRASAERNKRMGFNPFANVDLKKRGEAVREGVRKSEKHRKASSQNRSSYNKSEEGKLHLDKLHKSEKRKESCSKALTLYNKSEEHREIAREVLRKMQLSKLTLSQKILSKALFSNGIKNIVEWWIPEFRRFIDIAITENKLAIEVDGASHFNREVSKLFGGQTLEERQIDDRLKDEQLKSLGWKVIRVTDNEIKANLEDIVEKISNEVNNVLL